jgi:protein ImuB
MPRRIACIALPDIRVELARERDSLSNYQSSRDFPHAIIVARPGGAVQTDRDVLGNTRIDFVSREAGALGICAGQTVAMARAKSTHLRVRVIPEGTVRSSLARIAEAALAFGPATAFDVSQDVVWVDVSGCARLYGSEVELARLLGARVRALGFTCRVAVADGPRIAAAVVRFSAAGKSPPQSGGAMTTPPQSGGATIKNEPMVVPEGEGALVVRTLPIAALGLDEDTSSWLADLGLFTCGDLQQLPRRSLGLRLGEQVHEVMQLLDGRDNTSLDVWRPPEIPEERIELDWGAHSTESLAFVLKTLCDRLMARLQGRAMAAARLELVLTLDRALCQDPSRHRVALSMTLPSPIAQASDLLAVVRARLDGCSFEAPVIAVTLRAPELARPSARTLHLFEPEPKADQALSRLVAELYAELGEEAVGLLTLVDTWLPTERTRLVPFADATTVATKHRYPLVSSALEPSRLVRSEGTGANVNVARKPERSEGTGANVNVTLTHAQHLARIEAVEWWRYALTSHESLRIDLFEAWVASPRPPQAPDTDGALAWLELRTPNRELLLRGWMD